MQEVMLSEALRGGSPGKNILQIIGWLEEDLDPAALRAAWVATVARHEALRVRVIPDVGGRPELEVLAAVALDWTELDWREARAGGGAHDDDPEDPAAIPARLEDWLRADRRRGFAWSGAPWSRVTLIRTGARRWVLVWTVHHVLVDGGSFALVVTEVFEACAAVRSGAGLGLEPAPGMGRFAAWVAERGTEEARRHWRALLAGLETVTPPPLAAGGAGDEWIADREMVDCVRRLPTGFSARLSAAAAERGVTPSTLILGAWALLLARYAGVDDVVFGAVRSGRSLQIPDVDRIVGCCINTLPLRIRIPDDAAPGAWLKAVHEQWQATREHTAAGWDAVATSSPLAPGRRLFRSIVVVDIATLDGTLRARGGEWENRRFEVRQQPDVEWSLAFALDPAPELRLFHPAGAVDAAAAGRVLDHFTTLLEGLMAGGHATLGSVPMLPPEERRRIVAHWGAGPIRDWPESSLTALLEAQVDLTPDAVAVVCGEQSLTFAELDRRANRWARFLRRQARVGPDQTVALRAERSLELVVGMLAVLKAGGAYVPIDPGYPEERTAYLLADSGAVALLTQACLAPDSAVATATVPTWRLDADEALVATEADARPGEVIRADQLAYVLYTSGSTGQPKGVMVPHRAIANHMRWMQERFPVGPEDAVLQKTPIGFDASVWEFFLPLLTGARLVLAPPEATWDMGRLIATVRAHRVTTIQFVPSLLAFFLEHPEAPECRTLERIFSGGEVLSGPLRRRVRERLAVELVNLYGPTEAAIDTLFWVCDGEGPEADGPVPIGRPVANTQVRLLDRARRPVPAGVPGELWLGGAQIGRGYWGRPDLTAAAFESAPAGEEDGSRWYRTGDLCRWRADGAVEFLGRADEQVKVRGWRVEIGEIENALLRHPAVQAAAVVARPLGAGSGSGTGADAHELVACLVLRPEVGATPGEIRQHLGRRLPDALVPRAFLLLPELPHTPNGKVDRLALRALDVSSAWRDERVFVAPRDPVESTLAAVWSDVLGLERVGIEENFFALGGHSLLAMKVAAQVSAALGIDLPVRWFFEHPTIAGLAEQVRLGQAPQTADPILPVPAGEPIPLSREQERLWFLHHAQPEDATAYNVPLATRFRGAIDAARLERAFGVVVARHAILRTAFVEVDGVPCQWVSTEARVPAVIEVPEGADAAAREEFLRRRLREEMARPFDLAVAPLIRLFVWPLAPDETVVLVLLHHLVCDEWASAQMFAEVVAAWSADEAGTVVESSSTTSASAASYADYAAWQRRRHAGPSTERDRAFWRAEMEGAALGIEWPAGRAATPGPGGGPAAGVVRFEVDRAIAAELERIGREAGMTSFMTWLAAWQALLHRVTGQEDIVLGTPVTLRCRAELQATLGFFLNTVPVRSRLEPSITFHGLLRETRRRILDAFEHRDLPLDEILAAGGGAAGVGTRTLRSSFVVVAETFVLALPGLVAEAVDVDPAAAKFELSLLMGGGGPGRWPACLEFATGAFDPEQARRLAESFVVLLRGLVRSPNEPVARLPILTDEERRRVVEEFNRTRVDYPSGALLHRLFEEQARRTPSAMALEFEGAELSYAELDRRANQVAGRLRGLGVGPDVLVAVCAERSLELLVALLGILKAGGAYVPLDPGYPEERLRFMVEDSEAPVVLVQERFRSLVARDGITVLALDAEWSVFAGEPTEAPEVALTPDHLAYMIYTSGSTGRPKGAQNSHRGICNRLLWGQQEFPIGVGDVVVQKTPTSFDVSVWELFWPLVTGARELLARPGGQKDPEYLLRLFNERGATVTHFVPSMLQVFLEAAGDRPAPSLRHVFCSGEAVWPDLEKRFRAWSRAPLHNLYGPTEAAVEVSRWTCRADFPHPFTPIGRPIANTQLHILDPFGQPVGIGVKGELYIGGVQVARGYWRRPELNAERFVPDPFSTEPGARLYRTGDACRWMADGNIEYLGRLDGQVKIRGFRVELGEIEAALGAHPEVHQAAVIVRDGPGGVKELVGYLVPAGATPPSAEQLRAHLRARLPEYMVPPFLVAVPSLPLNPSGKVDRGLLATDRERGTLLTTASEAGSVAPRDALEAGLAALWEELLGRKGIGVHDDFFALGGHSLLAMQMAARWGRAQGIEVPVRWAFEAPTVALLAERTRSAAGVSPVGEPGIEPDADGRAPLSPEQERLWFLHHALADGVVYSEPTVTRLRGPLDPARLHRAFVAVIARQPSLRTAFVATESGSAQVVQPAVDFDLPFEDVVPRDGETPEAALDRRLREEVRIPFDLARPPLLRARCFRVAPEEHVLAVSMHHLVCDDGAIRQLSEDLRAAWQADTGERPEGSVLPPLASGFEEFARWRRRRVAGAALEAHREYWRRELEGAPESVSLEGRAEGAAAAVEGRTERGWVWRMDLADDVGSALEAAGAREGATAFVAWLAVFAAWLHRVSGQDDLLVGTPVSLRRGPEHEAVIGFFANTLPIRSRVNERTALRELMRETRRRLLDALDHREVPLDEILRRPGGGAGGRHPRSVSVAFVFQPEGPNRMRLPGLSAEPVEVDTGTAKFDLTLCLARCEGGGWRAMFETSADRFRAEDAGWVTESFRRIAAAAATEPDRALAELPLVDREDEERRRRDETANRPDYPRDASLWDLFQAAAKRWPEREAVVGGEERLSYRALEGRALALARVLRARGVGTGDRVALFLDRSADFVVAVLGTLAAGAVYVPLPVEYPVARLAHMLTDTAARGVVANGALPPELAAAVGTIPVVDPAGAVGGDSAAGAGAWLREGEVRGGDAAYVMYTSGSTGGPKGVVVPQRAVARLVLGSDFVPWSEQERFLLLAPTAFDASTLELWGPLLHGGACVVMPSGRFDLGALELRLAAERITTLWLTAGLFNRIIDEAPEILRGVRRVLTGGEALSVTHVRRAMAALPGVELINGYGPTESTTFACTHRIAAVDAGPGADSIPIGRPIANTVCRVLDPGRRPLPDGMAGELYLGGDGLALGYLNRPELTAERFVADPSGPPGARLYRTGDRCRRRADGVFEYLGRLDEQVKIRGHRIEPGEIEAVLVAHPGVRQAAVVPRPRPDGTRELVAFVVFAGGGLSADALRSHLRGALPEPMIPAEFAAVAELPLTAQGKVDRRALLASGGASLRSQREYVAPRDATEEALAGIWAELLGRERVGVEDDFFELGGHSLLAMQVAARAGRVLRREIPVRWLFEHPTIAALAVAVASGGGGSEDPIVPVPPGEPLPLSHEQERLWFLHHALGASPVYNVAFAVRLRGPLDTARLGRAWAAVIARHPSLRTGFVDGEDGPRQVVHDGLGLAWVVDEPNPGAGEDREEMIRRLRDEEGRRPFSLETPPLVRVRCWRVGPDEHEMMLNLHHLVCDEWSLGILLAELGEYWRADLAGRSPAWTALPATYGDYAAWQRRRARAPAMERQREFWRSALGDAAMEVDWPVARESDDRGNGGGWDFDLDPVAAEALERIGRGENATPFMIWFAAFQAFLHRFTGQAELVTGTPVSLRHRPELQSLVGFFLNTLPVRTRGESGTTFRTLLRAVRESALDAFEHRDLPLDEILRLDGGAGPGRRLRSVRVAFVLSRSGELRLDLPGVTAEFEAVDTATAKFELTLFVSQPAPGRWRGKFEFDTGLFDEADARRMASGLAAVVAQVGSDPDIALDRLELWAAGDLGEGGEEGPAAPPAVRVPLPEGTVVSGFERAVRRGAEAVAVVGGGETVSYAELNRRANRLAHHLRALGVGPDVPVGVFLERSPAAMVVILGILKAGGFYVPFDPAFPAERLSWMFSDSGCLVVITEGSLRVRSPAAAERTLVLGDLPAGLPDDDPSPRATPDHLAYLLYTSGSTGRPKGVAMGHRALVNLLAWQVARSAPAPRTLQFAALGFDVSFQEMFSTWWSGGTLVLVPPEVRPDAVALWEYVRAERIERLFLPVVMLHQLAEAAAAGAVSSEFLREVITAGEALRITPAVRFFFRAHPGTKLDNHYGPTEAHVVTAFQLPPEVGTWPDLPPIGTPLPNVVIRLLDRGGRPVPRGAPGELWIGGVALARGYWQRPGLTAERFVPDRLDPAPGARLYRTGDLASWTDRGQIEYHGRIDSQVKIRGFRVELEEVESALLRCPGIRAAAVVARGGSGGSGNGTLFGWLVVDAGQEPAEADLKSALARELPPYMIPAAFACLDRLPLSPNGKVDRRALSHFDGGRLLRAREEFAAPRTPEETALAGIWSSLLGRENIGVRDDFFALGGHSLLALRLVFEVRRRLGWTIPVSTLFAHPTIEGLVSASGVPRPRSELIHGPGTGPPLFFVPGVPGVNYLPAALLEEVGRVGRFCDALQFPGVDGREQPLDRVDELAAYLLRRLREIQPEGPFCLAGYSLGGNVAYEMACQLEEAGSPPVLVVLFDAFAHDSLRRRTWWEAVRATTRHLRRLGPGGAIRFLRQRLIGKVQARQSELVRELGLSEAEGGALPETRLSATDEVRKRVFDASFRAIGSYRARPYRGRVLLFRSAERDVAYGLFREADALNGWSRLALGSFLVEDVPGDHWQILAEGRAGYLSQRTAFHLAALARSP